MNLVSPQSAGIDQEFQPEQGFVRFFKYQTKLGGEISR